ncbi:MAG: class-II fumarase/aspartase family protein, partial [Candidatus Limnocylindrales bacterium]
MSPIWLPLVTVFGDPATAELFSEQTVVRRWIYVLTSLAEVQAELGMIPAGAGAVIARELPGVDIDFELLRERTRVVGYPILPLLEQLRAKTPAEVADYVHWGTTTQDIMDTALVLQCRAAVQRVDELTREVGDAVASLASRHINTVMAGRTHGQHAVPTTLGAKCAVWLSELSRARVRIRDLRPRLLALQLFGAGGTSASFAPYGMELRGRMAKRLELGDTSVPWHVARDSVAELGFVLVGTASICAQVATEIATLSRTEISEIKEGRGRFRGASSTMPQKENPIACEAIIGMSECSSALLAPLLHGMRAGHERSMGEWQMEWDSLPLLFAYSAGCLRTLRDVFTTLFVDEARMRENMAVDGGMVSAEAGMMALAPIVGRGRAHEIMYDVCRRARTDGSSLVEEMHRDLSPEILAKLPPLEVLLDPSNYLGDARIAVAAAQDVWSDSGHA